MLFVLLFLLLPSNAYDGPEVQVGKTKIVGEIVNVYGLEVHQFQSVPYAEPPTGNNRFRKPVPIKEYPPVLKAVGRPPACVQYSKYPFPWYENTTDMGEDCLYLNIWKPADANPQNLKAVMFWIHGGGFLYGSCRSDLYNATALSALGDIIVVTINYRLNVFGFLAMMAKNAIKNAGLWDMLEALRWVNFNIASFGGDASRITIAGESAGSIAVGALSVSPQTRGLFARQIMQSGSPLVLTKARSRRTHAYSEELAVQEGCRTGSKEDVVECLRGKNAHTLAKDYDGLLFIKGLYPVIGDEFLPGDVRKTIQNGRFKCNQLLIGNNANEGSVLYSFTVPALFGFLGERAPNFEKIGTKVNEFLPKSLEFIGNATGNLLQEAFYGVLVGFSNLAGDLELVCPDVDYADQCSKKGGRAYFYWFDYRPSTNPWAKWMGVTHFSEIQFVFGQPFLHPELYQEDEVELSREMVHIWSSFVKFGNPGIKNWPQYNQSNHIFKNISINPDPLYGRGPEETACNFLRPFEGL